MQHIQRATQMADTIIDSPHPAQSTGPPGVAFSVHACISFDDQCVLHLCIFNLLNTFDYIYGFVNSMWFVFIYMNDIGKLED